MLQFIVLIQEIQKKLNNAVEQETAKENLSKTTDTNTMMIQ